MKTSENLHNLHFGKWEVIGTHRIEKNRNQYWLCRCECGTERMVAESSLKSGASKSCGCVNQGKKIKLKTGDIFGALTVIEKVPDKNVYVCQCQCGNMIECEPYELKKGLRKSCGCRYTAQNTTDISGQVFGKLKVIEKTNQKDSNGAYLWRCQCECGKEKLATYSSLISGKIKSCGCLLYSCTIQLGECYGDLVVIKKLPNSRYLCRCKCGKEKTTNGFNLKSGRVKSCGCLTGAKGSDITGMKYGRLTAIKPTDKRFDSSVVWKCRCDCGKKKEASVAQLTSGQIQSCGCLQDETRRDNFSNNVHFVEDTCVERIASTKLQKNNTSGCRGVYFSKTTGYWIAAIGFQKKYYHLGAYRNLDDAVNARKSAENELFGNFLKWYYQIYPKG